MKSPNIFTSKAKPMTWMLSGCFITAYLSFLTHQRSVLQDGYWELTPELGPCLNFNVDLFVNVFLKSKGIDSLGESPAGPLSCFVLALVVL